MIFPHTPFSRRRHFGISVTLMLLAFSALCTRGVAMTPADYELPPQDEDGWTVLTPSAESRLIYVDSELGDDTTGVVYSVGDEPIGNDPQNPVGEVQAFKTLFAAYIRVRDDQPDWILLRAGRVWENQPLQFKRGLSPEHRAVICPYGEGERPELRTGSDYAIANRQAMNIIISGIKFWSHTRDPDGPYFTSTSGTDGFWFYNRTIGDPNQIENVLFEDCLFRAYRTNTVGGRVQTENRAPVVRFVMRRCIISGYYGRLGAGESFSIGLNYSAHDQPETVPPAVFVEETTFYHNGWYDVGDEFNHNTYFSNSRKVLFKGNFFIRGSSLENKWTANSGSASASQVVMENNFYTGGEVAISSGGNNPGAFRFKGFEIRNNVFTNIGDARPTGRTLAWHIIADDWDGGEIVGNLMLNQVNPQISNVSSISLTAQGGMRNVRVANNITYNVRSGGSNRPMLIFYDSNNVTNVEFSNNVTHIADSSRVTLLRPTLGGYSFTGANSYFSSNSPTSSMFGYGEGTRTLTQWKEITGDAEATFEAPDWEDPNRTIERYVSELGLGSTQDDFFAELHKQAKYNWREELTAPVVNDWFRAGFVSPSRNDVPTAKFSMEPFSGCGPLNVEFDASSSTDGDEDDTLTYEWDFDDGNGFVSGDQVEEMTFENGVYNITLRVSDGVLFDTESAVLTVGGTLVTGISIESDPVDLLASESKTLPIVITPDGVCDASVTWSSSDPDKVSVTQEGLVEWVSHGHAVITVTSNENSGVSASILVKAIDPAFWGPFSRDTLDGTVLTEGFLGRIVQGDNLDWIWVQTADKYVYLPEEFFDDAGSWFYIPHYGEYPEDTDETKWAGYAVDAHGNVDTGDDLLGLINVAGGNWVWIWSLNKYLYLEEPAVTDTGAWAYGFLDGPAVD